MWKFKNARIYGNLSASGEAGLTASVNVEHHWEREWELGQRVHLGNVQFSVGVIPVWVNFYFQLFAGASFDTSITGTLTTSSDFSASGTFDYTCSLDGCTGSSGFEDNLDVESLSAGSELRIGATVWLRPMLFANAYETLPSLPPLLWVGGGLRGLVAADLWGYYGSTCGDADGDGSNETVRALVADLHWGYDTVYTWGALWIPFAEETDRGPRHSLGWWDILDRLGQGKSTALQPMILGPAQVAEGTEASYRVKMRPCYPYAERVSFSIGPGIWSGNTEIPKPRSTDPVQNSATVSRVFNVPGSQIVSATTTTDSVGRNIQVPYNRPIQIACADTSPPSVSVTTPGNGAHVWGSTAFSATASDNVGVTRVDFKLGGEALCSDTSPPWSCSASVDGFSSGSYTVSARAFDGCGNSRTSVETQVTVLSNPILTVDAPMNGATVAGTSVPISGWATDPSGIASLAVTVDGHAAVPAGYGAPRPAVCSAVPANDPGCPNVGFSTTFDSTLYGNGSHTIEVVATDSAGISTSVNRSIIVNNPLPDQCSEGPTTLCLQNGRFQVEARYLNGTTMHLARARPHTQASGFFWFSDPTNLEIGVKVLGPLAGGWWVFHGPATHLEYILAVTDTQTGQVRTYVKPEGSFCGHADASAFLGTGAEESGSELDETLEGIVALSDPPVTYVPGGGISEGFTSLSSGACQSGASTLCLNQDRFKVEVIRNGAPKPGQELTSRTGAFSFGSADNSEVFVKVLGPINDRYWVFYGSLSNLEYTIKVTDTATDEQVSYTNPTGNYCGGYDLGSF